MRSDSDQRMIAHHIQRGALGHVTDQIAGSLSSRRSGFVAILVPSLNNPHFSETVLELLQRLDPISL